MAAAGSTRGGIDPQAMMMRMMQTGGGPLDTSQSGLNLESTRNNVNGEFMAPPGMMPPPEILNMIMSGSGPPGSAVSDPS